MKILRGRELQAPGGRSWAVAHGGCKAKGMGCCPCDGPRPSVPLTASGRFENGCPRSPRGGFLAVLALEEVGGDWLRGNEVKTSRWGGFGVRAMCVLVLM